MNLDVFHTASKASNCARSQPRLRKWPLVSRYSLPSLCYATLRTSPSLCLARVSNEEFSQHANHGLFMFQLAKM
jgi:hypothetical protein